MKLNTFDNKLLVPYAHYLTNICPCSYLKAIREGFLLYHKGVISWCLELIWKTFEYRLPIMAYQGCFSMHEPWSPYYVSSKCCTYGLMAKAHTKNRNLAGKMFYQFYRNTSLFWCAWAR